MVILKQLDIFNVGDIFGFMEDTSASIFSNDGSFLVIDVAENLKHLCVKTSPITVPEKWIKDGEPDVLFQPLIDRIVGYDSENNPVFEQVPDTSYFHVASYDSFELVEDAIKKAAYEKEMGVNKYVKRIEYAKNILGTMAFLNEKKVLTVPQIIQLNTTYGPIKGLLETGSFGSAYQMIISITPTEIITAEDISVISNLISTFMTKEAQQ